MTFRFVYLQKPIFKSLSTAYMGKLIFSFYLSTFLAKFRQKYCMFFIYFWNASTKLFHTCYTVTQLMLCTFLMYHNELFWSHIFICIRLHLIRAIGLCNLSLCPGRWWGHPISSHFSVLPCSGNPLYHKVSVSVWRRQMKTKHVLQKNEMFWTNRTRWIL